MNVCNWFICKMPKVINKNRTEQNRNRARIFRSVQNILRQDRNVHKVIQYRYSTNSNPTIGLVSLHDSNSSDQFTRCGAQKSLVDQLRSWALEYHLTHRAVSKLLKALILTLGWDSCLKIVVLYWRHRNLWILKGELVASTGIMDWQRAYVLFFLGWTQTWP